MSKLKYKFMLFVKNRNISYYDKKYGYGYYSDDYKSKKVNKIFKWISKFTKYDFINPIYPSIHSVKLNFK